MKLVAGARLRRAQEGIWAARPYAARLAEVIAQVAARVDVRSVTDAELDTPVAALEADAGYEERARYNVIKAAKLVATRPEQAAREAGGDDQRTAASPAPFNSNINRRAERYVIDNACPQRLSMHPRHRRPQGRDYFKRKQGHQRATSGARRATRRRPWSGPARSPTT